MFDAFRCRPQEGRRVQIGNVPFDEGVGEAVEHESEKHPHYFVFGLLFCVKVRYLQRNRGYASLPGSGRYYSMCDWYVHIAPTWLGPHMSCRTLIHPG